MGILDRCHGNASNFILLNLFLFSYIKESWKEFSFRLNVTRKTLREIIYVLYFLSACLNALYSKKEIAIFSSAKSNSIVEQNVRKIRETVQGLKVIYNEVSHNVSATVENFKCTYSHLIPDFDIYAVIRELFTVIFIGLPVSCE